MILRGPKNIATGSYAGATRPTTDGGEEMLIKAHANLTAKTPYRIFYDANGPVTAAFVNSAIPHRVVVPETAVASGTLFWGKVRGPVRAARVPSKTYVALEGLRVHGGAAVGTGNAYANLASEFGYVTKAYTSATTTVDIYLIGREITSSQQT